MERRIAIYRAMFGNYDKAPVDLFIHPNIDYFFFTDNKETILPHYQVFTFDECETPALNNRHLKIMSHDVLSDYEVTIYIDANIAICRDLTPIINKFLCSDSEFGLFRHPWNKNVEQECRECVAVKGISNDTIRAEIKHFQKSFGEPRTPHTDNSIIMRRRLSARSQEAMVSWFAAVKRYSGRDQISFPYIRSKYGLCEFVHNFSPRDTSNPYFVVLPHLENVSTLKRLYISFKCLIKYYIKNLIWRLTRIVNRA